uniref:AT09976p n=1 Tax=Drosophila melanogaster TaxID=7227 RepID=E8NH56_DROME|nr:AT09976p [Drosophila melanogaster]
MGEQPIFTCQAHVFHIDPKTKRTWITASMKAVNVSFFYDSSRNLYRIISVEGTKAVINSTITPNMSNTNTQNANPDSPSHKLLNTSDVKADIGSATPSPQPTSGVTGGGGVTISSGGSIVGMHTGPGAGATAEQQLKYENERLKMALAQSCANAKKWEIELATLKNNNIRLTSALQESTANVDEWKRQLQKELMQQELELKSANISLREKSNDQTLAKLSEVNGVFAKHLSELYGVQKDMESIIQIAKCT